MLGGVSGALLLDRVGAFPGEAWAVAPPACVLTPELTDGPFFVDTRLERSDVRRDTGSSIVRPGVPLDLSLRIVDVRARCAPRAGAYVDIWQADAEGHYSAIEYGGTRGEDFLRGYQVTGADGTVRFRTIFPGAYPGRTVHIHLKVRVFTGTKAVFEFATQLFFEEEVTAAVMAQSAYAARRRRRTSNGEDGIFEDHPDLLVKLVGDAGRGFSCSTVLGLGGLPAIA